MKQLAVKILLCLCLPLFFAGTPSHPFHVSTAEITYSQKDQKLKVICTIFTDDFENTLTREYGTKADLSDKAKHKAMDVLVKKYIATTLEIKPGAKVAPLTYLRFEQKDDAVNIYLESVKLPAFKKIEVENSILLDDFPDQMNIVHIIVNGQRKSHRLDYPEHVVTEIF